MTPTEKLKEMLRSRDLAQCDLLERTLGDLAPELIELWEAIQTDRGNREYEENMDLTDNALKALNDKARSMVG